MTNFILTHIAEALFAVLWTAIVAFITAVYVKCKALKSGLQSLLRLEIIRSHEKYTERGFCPIYAKEGLTKAYKSYHELGGNDVATSLYEEVMKLPTDKGEKDD